METSSPDGRLAAAVLARHCPRCGHATERVTLERRERARCPACGFIDYGNPKPAVGALVAREGRILLSRRARPPHQDEWDLPGGFLELDEHPEAAIVRELAEETGLRARVVRLLHVGLGTYFGHGTLNLVYECTATGEPHASDDSAELRWFSPSELPPFAFPHEREAVERWLRQP